MSKPVETLSPADRTELFGGINVTNLRGLRRWRTAYADADQKLAKIRCIGDSIWWGVGSDNVSSGAGEVTADTLGWPSRLRAKFAREFGLAPAGVIESKPYIAQGSAGEDTRIVGAGKTSLISSGLMGLSVITNVSNAGAAGTWIVALPSSTCVEFTYYDGGVSDANSGSWTYSIDGGAAVAVAVTSTNTYKTIRVEGLAQAAHTVVVTATAAQNVQIDYFGYDNAKGVRVERRGRPGWTARDMIGDGTNSNVQSAAGKVRWQKGLTAGSPDIVIFGFGHNDCVQQLTAGQLTTAALHKSIMQASVDAVVAAGSCVLLVSSPWPRLEAAGGPDNFDAYWTARDEIAAATDHCAHVRISDLWGTAEQANETGRELQITNSVHPNRRGYGDIANGVYRVLTSRDLAA